MKLKIFTVIGLISTIALMGCAGGKGGSDVLPNQSTDGKDSTLIWQNIKPLYMGRNVSAGGTGRVYEENRCKGELFKF